jgi:hypothetical protein
MPHGVIPRIAPWPVEGLWHRLIAPSYQNFKFDKYFINNYNSYNLQLIALFNTVIWLQLCQLFLNYLVADPYHHREKHRRMGQGGTCPPPRKFLRSGKNQCDIRAKHKNFGKIWYAVKTFLYRCENYVMLGKIFVCPAKFSYVYWQVFGYVRKIFRVCPEKSFCYVPKKFFCSVPTKFFGDL